MTPSDERTLAHARAIRARGVALPPEGPPPGVILDSWARCMDVGLAPGAALTVPVMERPDLARRRERSEFVRRLAQAELETLSRQIAGSNFLLAFADDDGVILDLYADNRFTMSGADAGILAGSMWAEQVAGTNGLGTALATGGAVAVTGLEHYFLQLGDISCTAAPVRDAKGRVVGVLDASSYYESRQRHTQALVQMAATHIENGLLAHQMRGHLVLALHPRAEFLGTLSAGLLAFDSDGRLVAVNGPGRNLLSGLDAQLGTRFEELFREPIEHVLARLHLGGEVRLRDALGSALVARMVGRPAGDTTQRRVSAARTVGAALVQGPVAAASPSTQVPAFLASDPAVAEACRLVEAAVRMNVPVLLQGETGTGKEMLARHAHLASGRSGAFVAVNCAALPPELFEAELFGHVGGAFTGARREGSPGLIMAADGGTLLLDEVCDLPLQLQAALLRFLDDQMVRPVGGSTARRVDVQLLAACHADLDDAVHARSFREDLLYRLNTVRVTLPPLRQRRDLPEAARWVLAAIDPHARLGDDAVDRLARHAWPGNFRELRSVLTRALLAGIGGGLLRATHIDAVLPTATAPAPQSAPVSLLQRSAAELVRAEYERTGRSVSQTSRNLGISRTTVYRHLQGAAGRSGRGAQT
jgi:transcriptional regulator of acetoin/glycerol metabolism